MRLTDIRPEDTLAPGTGRLVKNKRRTGDGDADLTGTLRVGEKVVRLSAWLHEAPDGETFIRLSAK